MAGEKGNVHVLFDYQNIVLVDPNKLEDKNGNITERLVEHENMVMYANLEAKIVPRTKLIIGDNGQDQYRTISIAKINFLKPNDDEFLNSGYVDEITGLGSTEGKGINQNKEEVIRKQGQTYIKNSVIRDAENNTIDNGLLGITEITIKTNTSFIPTVNIRLEDVQGRALFAQGDNSPYAAFYNLPYPPFYLTLKGFYGKAVRYELVLNKFNASFNSTSGNYQINLEFYGYKYNILNEIPIASLLAVPHMYSKRFEIKSNNVTPQGESLSLNKTSQSNFLESTNRKTTSVFEVIGEKGYQKIIEVYKEYKAKNLIDQNFPELTLLELMNKLDLFEQNILNSYSKVDVGPLTDARLYKSDLANYYKSVRSNAGSWFNIYMNPKAFYLKGSAESVYRLKDEYANDAEKALLAISKLKNYIDDFNGRLSNNESFGKNSSYNINNPINFDYFVLNIDPLTQIDWETSYTSQTGKISPTEAEYLSYRNKFSIKNLIFQDKVIPQWFKFDGINSFSSTINSIEAQFNSKLSQIETSISLDLSKKIEDNKTGIGFKPTVRNIIAVIMASAEAFIRLMDETHSNAWAVKTDPDRIGSVLNNNASVPSSDNLNIPKILGGENLEQVYPWPQVFIEKFENKENRFQIVYPGDPLVINKTKANIFSKWPEVEFVEEYLKGLVKKFSLPVSQDPLINQNDVTNRLSFNAIEFPLSNTAFSLKEEIKFFYEIWERVYLSVFYSGFDRIINTVYEQDFINMVSFVEKTNINRGLSESSPFLISKFKEFFNTGYYNGQLYVPLNQENYVNFLMSISNMGSGKSYQEFKRDLFVTNYIGNITKSPNKILSLDEFTLSKKTNNTINEPIISGIKRVLDTSVSNNTTIFDVYPYSIENWSNTNLGTINGYGTTLSLFLNEEKNLISNFTNVYDYLNNRPVTNFSYIDFSSPVLDATNNIESFYSNRIVDNMLPTEGSFGNITTSMLNTPYFVNSIQDGVEKWRSGEKYPYVSAAYLFLNSLPLAGVSQKYKNYGLSDSDFIFATMTKFDAIHKLPYVWVLKYGSIWHRYKKFKREGVDIISDIWVDFNYSNNFDPINSSLTKNYSFNLFGKDTNISAQTSRVEGSLTETIIQPGFYPKTINDFNVFLNGYDLYTSGYTQQEIQNSIDRGVKVVNLSGSNIIKSTGFDLNNPNRLLTIKPWTVLVPLSIDDSINYGKPCAVNQEIKGDYFIMPSFGFSANEALNNCFNNNGILIEEVENNNYLYNGSVRSFWGAPNYGYFDSSFTKPEPDEYLVSSYQSEYAFSFGSTYSKIEDIFSVFSKDVLDIFENEFLNYSRSIYDIVSDSAGGVSLQPIDLDFNDKNSIYKNFQLTMRDLFSVPSVVIPSNLSDEEKQVYFVNETIKNQVSTSKDKFKNIMSFDVIFKFGNPKDYDRYSYDSVASHVSGTDLVTEPLKFNPYVKGSLPSSSGDITLAQSLLAYPNEWAVLETNVGFSTLPGLAYTNNGSYITDYFIDNNIEFSVTNIEKFSMPIKIYANQKYKNNSYNSTSFSNDLLAYRTNQFSLHGKVLGDTLNYVSNSLSNIEINETPILNTAIDGGQSKVEIYEVFKALNDKWISGGDYQSRTLFEDILFLDRGSRNIGDKYLIDIFALKNTLNQESINLKSNVFLLVSNILIQNNFTVMPMPSYINFYNTQDVGQEPYPDNSNIFGFADDMWGTYLEVDYRKSGPKLVCFYVDRPSTYVSTIDNKNYLFRDDAFNMLRESEIPFLESQEDKKDWALSNKCVGFVVDVGTRNQNIFYGFNMSQDSGKATSETLNMNYLMGLQASGRNVSTQNVSLYNVYKNLSYDCEVVSLGNAMIQPTMYFNLQHVPLFNGPYFITEVNHNITPGNFQTSFKGTRQGIFTLPTIDRYLQSINENLLTKIEQRLNQGKEQTPITAETNQQKINSIPTDSKNKKQPENTCSSLLADRYSTFVSVNPTETYVSLVEMANSIKERTNNPVLQTMVYVVSYLFSYKDGMMRSYNNTYANIELTKPMSPTDTYFSASYCCIETSSKRIVPLANFNSLDNYLSFVISRIEPNIGRIGSTTFEDDIAEYYIRYFPLDRDISDSDYDLLKPTIYPSLIEKIKAALKSAQSVGIDALGERKKFDLGNNGDISNITESCG